MTATLSFDPTVLREAFSAYPSGVVAVAGLVDGVPVGLAASSFTSVSIEPALVSFSVANTSSTWPVLRRAGQLGLSVLASHHDEVCRQLAGPAEERFDDLPVHVGDGGEAVLLDDAVASFECTIDKEVEAGDHTLVLLALQSVHDRGGDALVFHRSVFPRLVTHDPGI